MRVFVTGATGFVGSAMVQELLSAGHQVLGLARNDASAAALKQLGIEVHRGELTDTPSLVAGAKACDGVIHTAFIHDFSQFEVSVEVDRRAVMAMVAALEGTDKPFVSTSGTALVSPGCLCTEADEPLPTAHRAAAETLVIKAAERGLRSSLVRLPPSVHGRGDHGFVPMLIDIARRTGVVAYVGFGANRWPAVHRLDAARLYRLALEKAAPGTRLHGAAEEGVLMRDIAEAIGRGLGLPVQSLTEAEAQAHFGWFVRFAAIDNPVSSALTRERFGWQPGGIGLLEDIAQSGYFDA